jgi:hypothetical protein
VDKTLSEQVFDQVEDTPIGRPEALGGHDTARSS